MQRTSYTEVNVKSPVRAKGKGGRSMGGTIRARVRRGLLEPLEKIDLPEGKEVTIAVLESPTELNVDAFRRAAGSWKGSVDATRLSRKIYADRLIRTRRKPRL